MKFFLPVLFLTGLFLPTKQVSAQSSIYTMDVVCWNIEYFGAPYNSGPADKELQRENAKKIMRYFDADIYGLCEIVDTMQLRRLRDSLGANFEYVVSPTSSNGTLGSNGWRQAQKLAFLYKKDIFTNVSTRSMFTTSSTAYTSWASGRFPFLMKADATIQGITRTFYFIMIHGKSGSSSDDYNRRRAGAEELKDTLDAQFSSVNVLIIGDYNDALNRTISSGSGPESSYHPIVVDSTDADHYKSITLPLAVAGQSTMINYPNVIDNHIISNEVTPYYVLNSAKVRTDVTAVVPNYVTAHNTSDHYPVFSQYSLAGLITSIPQVPASLMGIALYPNPSDGEIFFKTSSALRNLRVRVLNATGQVISTHHYESISAGAVTRPDLPTLQRGLYLVEFITGNYRSVLRFIR